MSIIYDIDPVEIQLAMIDFEFNINEYDERTVDGDWDLNLSNFDVSIAGNLLRSLRTLEQGYMWEDTEYWQFLERSLSNGVIHCGVHSMSELRYRCYEFINRLVDETREAKTIPQNYNKKDYVGISITRDGLPVFNNGRHRLCIAKYLNIPSIPININVRHKEWVNFKQDVKLYMLRHNNQVYASLRHVDLCNIKSCHSKRIEIIQKNIGSNCVSVLDLGAHWGSHSIYLSQYDMSCLAVENNVEAIGFLHKLIKASGQNIKTFNGSIFDLGDHSYDIALALRIFHHFLKTKDTYDGLIEFLHKLDVRELYFQPHDISTQNMEGSYKNLNTSEFVQLILHNSNLTNHLCIGHTIGGPIFKFYSDKYG